MSYLVAAVVLVGVVALLDLALCLAILRKLRRGQPHDDFDPDTAVRALRGQPVPDFAATTRDGVAVTGAGLAATPHLIGFFSTRCPHCLDEVPGFRQLAADSGLAPLAVVDGDASAEAPLLTWLGPVPTVVEAELGPVAQAFGVVGYPMFVRTGEGGVLEAALSVHELA